jgi:crossover junction endodeoxyribonuclease RusA
MEEVEPIDPGIAFDVPYPPTVNTYWRMWRNRMVLSGKGREYKGLFAMCWRAAGAPVFGNKRVGLIIRLHPPDKRRRDADNTIKGIQDSLQACGCIDDDSQIYRLIVVKESPAPKLGKATIVVYALPEGDQCP